MLRTSAKYLFLTLGWVFFAIGIVGILVPLLPTTPFLILAAYCFSKGSQRLYHWLITRPHAGPAILDWEKHGVIRPRAKRLATALIVALFTYTLGFVPVSLPIKATVALIGVACLTFIWSRPSRPR